MPKFKNELFARLKITLKVVIRVIMTLANSSMSPLLFNALIKATTCVNYKEYAELKFSMCGSLFLSGRDPKLIADL